MDGHRRNKATGPPATAMPPCASCRKNGLCGVPPAARAARLLLWLPEGQAPDLLLLGCGCGGLAPRRGSCWRGRGRGLGLEGGDGGEQLALPRIQHLDAAAQAGHRQDVSACVGAGGRQQLRSVVARTARSRACTHARTTGSTGSSTVHPPPNPCTCTPDVRKLGAASAWTAAPLSGWPLRGGGEGSSNPHAGLEVQVRGRKGPAVRISKAGRQRSRQTRSRTTSVPRPPLPRTAPLAPPPLHACEDGCVGTGQHAWGLIEGGTCSLQVLLATTARALSPQHTTHAPHTHTHSTPTLQQAQLVRHHEAGRRRRRLRLRGGGGVGVQGARGLLALDAATTTAATTGAAH